MIYKDYKNDNAAIGNIVPGYAFYSGIGYSLAEKLVDLIEWLIDLRR